MGRKARSSPWNAGSPRQKPGASSPSDVGGHRASARRGLASACAAVGFAWDNRAGRRTDGLMDLLDQETRAFGQPSRGKACDLSPTHSLDRPPAANPDAGAPDPCATQRRVRVGPQFSGDGTWPVDGTGAGTRHRLLRGASFCNALQGFGRPCCSRPRTPGGPRKCGAPGWHPQGGRAGRRWPKSSRG